MGAAGAPRYAIPDWLNHTVNAKDNDKVVGAPDQNPGPNAKGVVKNNTTITGPNQSLVNFA